MLPPELLFYISNFLDPVYKYNFYKTLCFSTNTKFENEFQDFISEFCKYDRVLISKISKIIKMYVLSEKDILHILKELYFIIKRSKKYTDILGYSFYKFIIFRNEKCEDSQIVLHPNYIFEEEKYHIHIYYHNPYLLCKFLDAFLQQENYFLTYTIKHYHL